jgi:hypothetical protein
LLSLLSLLSVLSESLDEDRQSDGFDELHPADEKAEPFAFQVSESSQDLIHDSIRKQEIKVSRAYLTDKRQENLAAVA